MSEELKTDEVKAASTDGQQPENKIPPAKKLEKKINIIAVVAILAIIGAVFFVISKDAARRNTEQAEPAPVYSMDSRDASGLAVPAPPPVTPPAAAVAKPQAPKAPPADIWASLPDPVAEMDGKPISKQTLINAFNSQFPDNRPPANYNAEMIRNLGFKITDNYVNHEILVSIARAKGVTINQAEVVKMLNDLVKNMDPIQMNMLKSSLTAQKLTLEAYINNQANDKNTQDTALLMKYGEQIKEGIKVTDAELKEAYDKMKEEYFIAPPDQPGTIRASHILFIAKDQDDKEAVAKALEQAKKTREELRKNPEKFSEIAAAVSDCPSKSQGGSLGAFGKGTMVKPFEDAAYQLKEGEISEPVLSQFGYHIIRRDPSSSGSEKSFDEVKDMLALYLRQEKVTSVITDELNKVREERKVKILVPEPPPAPRS